MASPGTPTPTTPEPPPTIGSVAETARRWTHGTHRPGDARRRGRRTLDRVLRDARLAAFIGIPGRHRGYSGYFRDLDGHLWEVAHNPFFELTAEGRILLPDAQ
jgi:catechol 2,3-dioxygenase-like lactoylglutathione lyase family enzyme